MTTQCPSTPLVASESLSRIGLFGGLPDDALAYLAQTLRATSLEPGDIVFHEGERASEMYVVLSGEFEVVKGAKKGGGARMAMLGSGDWFGEMSILDVQPRSATVRALAPSHILTITAADLDALYRRDLKAYALLVLNIARELSRRLRVADGILANLVTSVLNEYAVLRRGTAI